MSSASGAIWCKGQFCGRGNFFQGAPVNKMGAENPENPENPDRETAKTRDISENPENPEIEQPFSGLPQKCPARAINPEAGFRAGTDFQSMVAQSLDSPDSLKCHVFLLRAPPDSLDSLDLGWLDQGRGWDCNPPNAQNCFAIGCQI